MWAQAARSAALGAVLALAVSQPASADFVRGKDVPLGFDVHDIAAADFNRDHSKDLALTGPRGVTILKGRGDGTFKAARRFPAGKSPGQLTVADLNQNGKKDLVATQFNDDKVSVLLGRRDGTFKRRINYRTGDGPTYVAVGRLNSDRYPDLAVTNVYDDDVSILINRGDGTFKRKVDYPSGSGPRSSTIADLNGDHKRDLVVADFEKLSIRKGRGDGTFERKRIIPMRLALSEVISGNFNHGHAPDLAVSNVAYNSSQGIHVLLGQGNGRFGGDRHYGFDSAPQKIAAADLTGSRRKDLIIETEGYPLGTGGPVPGYLFVLRGHRDGGFTRETPLHLDGQGGRFAIGALDGDARRDVASITYTPSPEIEIFLNQ